VATDPLPETLQRDLALHACCVSGAAPLAEVEAALRAAGFEQVNITPKPESRGFIRDWAPGLNIEDYVVAATIEAVRPFSVATLEPSIYTNDVAELVAIGAAIAANCEPCFKDHVQQAGT